MAPLVVTPAAEDEAAQVAEIHLQAMDSNELIHAQFPSREALDFLRGYLEKETVEFLRAGDKGVLVARENGQSSEGVTIASFIKWVVHQGDPDELMPSDEIWPSFCRAEYLNPYADLTARVRQSVMGRDPYYHVTFLCSSPRFSGQGGASSLLRRVQGMAAAEGKAVVLESTMPAVSFYERLGFQIAKTLDLMLPEPGSLDPSKLYEERCMIWRAMP